MRSPSTSTPRPRPASSAISGPWAIGPLVGLVASHPLHHTRLDLPDVTDGAMLEPVARGLAGIISAA